MCDENGGGTRHVCENPNGLHMRCGRSEFGGSRVWGIARHFRTHFCTHLLERCRWAVGRRECNGAKPRGALGAHGGFGLAAELLLELGDQLRVEESLERAHEAELALLVPLEGAGGERRVGVARGELGLGPLEEARAQLGHHRVGGDATRAVHARLRCVHAYAHVPLPLGPQRAEQLLRALPAARIVRVSRAQLAHLGRVAAERDERVVLVLRVHLLLALLRRVDHKQRRGRQVRAHRATERGRRGEPLREHFARGGERALRRAQLGGERRRRVGSLVLLAAGGGHEDLRRLERRERVLERQVELRGVQAHVLDDLRGGEAKLLDERLDARAHGEREELLARGATESTRLLGAIRPAAATRPRLVELQRERLRHVLGLLRTRRRAQLVGEPSARVRRVGAELAARGGEEVGFTRAHALVLVLPSEDELEL